MTKHYAIKAKARVFRYFDEGKKPSDIAEESLSRQTLYQYYAEWRRENGIKGKATGFAITPFVRGQKDNQKDSRNFDGDEQHTIISKEKIQDNLAERQYLDSFVLDCITVIDALKHQRPGMIFLPGSKVKKYLTDILRIKDRQTGKIVFLTFDQYIELFDLWMVIARKAKDREDFYKISFNKGINYEAPGL